MEFYINHIDSILKSNIHTPFYLMDMCLLKRNVEILQKIEREMECKIIFSQKAMANGYLYSYLSKQLTGSSVSSFFEAKMAYDYNFKEVHMHAPIYNDSEIEEIIKYCDYIVFNSKRQWDKHNIICSERGVSCGIRININYLYCGSGKEYREVYREDIRFGVTSKEFKEIETKNLDGILIHVMNLCDADKLWTIIQKIEQDFGDILHNIKWINFGGGLMMTKEDFDFPKLKECVMYIKNKYKLEVIFEPGDAVMYYSGYMVATIMDIIPNEPENLIMDCSPICHCPDAVYTSFKPPIYGSDEGDYEYNIDGCTCLIIDTFGKYRFRDRKKIGDKLIFGDMCSYSVVKNSYLNGINCPTIAIRDENDIISILHEYSYEEYINKFK